MEAKVTEHKVQKAKQDHDGTLPHKRTKKSLQMTSQVTRRTVARVLSLVDNKMKSIISAIVSPLDPNAIAAAMKDPEAFNVMQRHIASENIKLTDDNNQTVLKNQMLRIGNQGADADGSDLEEDMDVEGLHVVSANSFCDLTSDIDG
jgi:hypothetical protein